MDLIKRLFPLAILLAVWQLLSHLKLLNSLLLPSPLDVLAALGELFRSGGLWRHTFDSVRRVTLGFAAAGTGGVLLGLGAGYFPKVSDVLTPLFEFIRPIPPIAWIPLAILWFGLDDASACFIVFLGAFPPVFINSFWGVRATRSDRLNVARNFGASSSLILSDVILPGSLPQILHGLRIGLGLAWTAVIAAELVGVQSGLGYMIQMHRIMLKTPAIIGGMVMIACVGTLMNFIMLLIEKKLIPWDRRTLSDLNRQKVFNDIG